MLKVHSLFIGPLLFLVVSCSKDMSADNGNPPPGSANGLSDGNLLIKIKEVWNSGATDSTSYEYNPEKQLIATHTELAGAHSVYYTRDSLQRITDIIRVDGGDSGILHVWYAGPASGKVAYTKTRSTNQGTTYQDSSVYSYNAENQVNKIISYMPSPDSPLIYEYYSFAYDQKGNLGQLQLYVPDADGNFSLNLGYDFAYDDKMNPLFSHDDVRLSVDWYLSASPDNLVKQTNHYGDPPLRNDDFIELAYQYQSGNAPASSLRTGTAISPQTVQTTYFYQ